jgi:hypothetical protein
VWVVRRLRGRKAVSPAAPLLAAGVFAGSFLLAAGLGIGPFPRNFCPLLPLMALAEAWTLGELASAVRWKNERGELAAAAASALLIAAVLAPQLATYPRRLAAYCREHRGAHDGYFNYYAADYRVADVVERIKQLTAGRRPFRVCYAAEDQWNLLYYFQRAGQPLARRAALGNSGVSIYVIAPVQADWADIAARHELPAEELRKLPLIEDFGYYVLKGGRMKSGSAPPIPNH